MALEKLNRKDVRLLLIWILAGIAGAIIAHTYFLQAFPEASVDFQLSRSQALATARQFMASQGAHLSGYDSSIIFDVDDGAKTYLEREVGLKEANRIMAGNVHVWYWDARFFRPLQKEEFDVRVNPAGGPAGGIVGYSHTLPDTAAGAHLDRAAAQSLAESFLRETVAVDLSQYQFLEQEVSSTERPARRDWSFSWERHGFRAKDAPYRLTVTLAGDRVNGYEEFLKVPEAWSRDYQRLRDSNNFLEYIALIPYGFLLGGCLYVIIWLGRRGLLEWRFGIALGIFLTVLYFVMTMNQWPLDRAEYDTNNPYTTFLLSQVGRALLTSLVSALLVVLAVVPGEPLYRVLEPAKIRLNLGWRLPGIRTKEFFRANVIGICLAAVHIGYITVFYIISRRFGAWAPQDLNYENVVSTYIPWVYPLTIGIYAATSEEFLFRLFAIPFMQRVTKSRVLAVVLPAFFWGFLHSNYPQEPAYIRGIEVGLIGIIAGIVMLRWGIWATLTWHYTVDAFLISTSLLSSHGVYLPLSGAIVGCGALIPLGIAGVAYLRRGGFVYDEALLNRARPLAPAAEPSAETGLPVREPVRERPAAAEATPYAPMSRRALTVLVFCGMLGAALLAGVKREAIGDFIRFQIDARQAVERANEVLRQHRLDPSSFQHAATITYTFNNYTSEFLRRAVGIADANRIYQSEVPSAFWAVRYFRDSQNEDYLVVLKPDGSLHSLHHTLEEKAPGANLSNEEARERAEKYLRDEKKINLANWSLVDSQSEQKPARTDHLFEWEQKQAVASLAGGGNARIRMQVRIQGDEVSGYRVFIKIPEAWRDAESRTTTMQLAQMYGLGVAIAAFLIVILTIFLRGLKGSEIGRVPWHRITRWALWMPVAALVLYVNQIPQVRSGYTTTMPVAMYYATQVIFRIFGLSLDYAGVVLVLGAACFFVARAFGSERLPSWGGASGLYYRDALCVGIFGSLAILGVERLPALFAHWTAAAGWPLMRHYLEADVPSRLDWLLPASGSVAQAVTSAFIIVGLVGLGAGFVGSYIRSAWARATLLVLYAVLIATDVATPGSFVREAAFRLAVGVVIWFGVSRIVRFNALAYALLAGVFALSAGAFELLQQPNLYFRANGVAVVICLFAMLLWPAARWKRCLRAASDFAAQNVTR